MKTERYTEEMGKRHYYHHCSKCEFLISFLRKDSKGNYYWVDLYHSCDEMTIGIPILLRFGNEDWEYITSSGYSPFVEDIQDIIEHFFQRIYVRRKNVLSEDDEVQGRVSK